MNHQKITKGIDYVMKTFAIVAACIFVVLLILLTGCTTTSTITEFDVDGHITRVTKTELDPFDKITESVKDKTVIVWSDGWAAYVSASTATTEDPTPTAKIFAGKVAKGYISLLKDQQNLEHIAEIIQATRSELSVSPTSGISNTITPKKE